MKNGGEVYADFTVNRIVRALNESDALTDSQRNVLRQVLAAEQTSNRHAVDLRLSIPLFYRNYYLCLFAGRDRRKGTLNTLAIRWIRTQRGLTRVLVLLLLLSASFIFGALAIWGLYSLKTMLGIDLIPNWHFSDFVSSLFNSVKSFP